MFYGFYPPATTVPYMMHLCQAPTAHPPACDSWKYFILLCYVFKTVCSNFKNTPPRLLLIILCSVKMHVYLFEGQNQFFF